MKIKKVHVGPIDHSIPFLYPSRRVEITTSKGTILTPNRCATSYEFNRKQELPTTAPLDNKVTIYHKKLSGGELSKFLTGNDQFGTLLDSVEKANRLVEYSDLHISDFQLSKTAEKGPSPIEILSEKDNLDKFMRMYIQLHTEANSEIIPIPHFDFALDKQKRILSTSDQALEKLSKQPFYSIDLADPNFSEILKFVITDLQANCVNLIYRRYRDYPQSYEAISKYYDKDVAFIMTNVERFNSNNSDLSVLHYMPFYGNDLYAVQQPIGFLKKPKQQETTKKIRNIANFRILNRKELTIQPLIEKTVSNREILDELNSAEEKTLIMYLDNMEKARENDEIYKVINSLTRIQELQGSTKEFTVLGAYVKQNSAKDYIKSKPKLYERLSSMKVK